MYFNINLLYSGGKNVFKQILLTDVNVLVCGKMSMLHVSRSNKPKVNQATDLHDNDSINKNIVHCLYGLMRECRHYKTLSQDLVYQKLALVFDIDQIQDQVLKLSESVLGQCVQQIYAEVEPNTLSSITCKYFYSSRVKADRVKPGTSIPTIGHHSFDNKIYMHDNLQIMSKVEKSLIQKLNGIYEELLKAGDITSVKSTNAVKQNALASYYEYLDYQTKEKDKSMHAGLCYRLLEEISDRSPPVYALPSCLKDCSRQNSFSKRRKLLDKVNKFTFGLCKNKNPHHESQILAELLNIWNINTDNSLSPAECEWNMEAEGLNIPVSGVVILTDNLRVKLQSRIFARKATLKNVLITCDVKPEDFNPQKAFITDGNIKMDSTNLFVKEQNQPSIQTTMKKVEFLKMGTECFAIHVVDPSFYHSDTSAHNRFREVVSVDFMLPLCVQFKGQCFDDMFKKEYFPSACVPTKVYFKDQSGLTQCIQSNDMLPFVTGMLDSLNDFKSKIDFALAKLSKAFKLPHMLNGGEKTFIQDQCNRSFRNLYHTFPMHYHFPITNDMGTDEDSSLFEDIYQKPLWIMTSHLTYKILVTNIVSLWNHFGVSNGIYDSKYYRHSLCRSIYRSNNSTIEQRRLIIHGLRYVKKNNPDLYSWVADHGKQLKRLLLDKMKYPQEITAYVDYVIYLFNSKSMYQEVFSTEDFHPGLGFVLNRTEHIETESLLLSRIQGYKLFYSQTKTEANSDCQSPHYNLVTSMQTGHMPSALTHPCIKYQHCIVTDLGSMGTEIINDEIVFGKKKARPNYDSQRWIPIFTPCEISETMFEDSFNPFGRNNVCFEEEPADYFKPDTVVDPLSGLPGYNPMSLGLVNVNFIIYSDLFESHVGFTLKKHVVSNAFKNFWFNDYQRNLNICNNRTVMQNLQDNFGNQGELKLQYEDLSLLIGGSVSKCCYSHPKLIKTVMSEKGGGPITGKNVYRSENDYLILGSKLMEDLDRGDNVNDRFLLQ